MGQRVNMWGWALRLAGPWVGPGTVPGPQPSEMVKNKRCFIDGETEAQRQTGICSRSHNHKSVAEAGLELGSRFRAGGEGVQQGGAL